MKRFISCLLAVASAISLMLIIHSCANDRLSERPQWTEKQAWQWDKKAGIIKGFNQPVPSYPGMEDEEIIKKMSELGFNSVRAWISNDDGTAEDQVIKIKALADIAEKYGMTVSPVLYLQRKFLHRDASEEENLADAEKCVKTVVGPFKDDKRIILWDLWNEPALSLADSANVMMEMDWIEKEVHWCREEHLSQPITASIFWDTGLDADVSSDLFKRRVEVEQMMDIHNFHTYQCGEHFGEDVRAMIGRIKKTGDRPLVCTECLTRVNGSGVGRTLAEFSKEHVHFYIWGSYAGEANWEVKWERSTYDAYDPIFHNIMYSDGDLIDSSEIDYIKNYSFDDYAEKVYTGLEITERWTHERSWKRMSTGPVLGQCGKNAPSEGYNSVRVKMDYSKYYSNKDGFFAEIDKLVSAAKEGGYTIMPILLSDADASNSPEALGEYIGETIRKYYSNPVIQAWDLYYHPGETMIDSAKVSDLVSMAFKYARNEYPNQPLTSTPYVKVQKFADDFDYRKALVHGHRAGWNKLEYGGASNPDLVFKIWSLSDVISFSTDQPAGEAGWIASICYKFGRPVFCTELSSKDPKDVKALMELFGQNHIYWYSSEPIDRHLLKSFRFLPIETKH